MFRRPSLHVISDVHSLNTTFFEKWPVIVEHCVNGDKLSYEQNG